METILIIGKGFMGASLGMALQNCYNIDYYDTQEELSTFDRYKKYDFYINCTGKRYSELDINFLIRKTYNNTIDISSFMYEENDIIFAHPLCGSEKSGHENADPSIFEGNNCIFSIYKSTLPNTDKKRFKDIMSREKFESYNYDWTYYENVKRIFEITLQMKHYIVQIEEHNKYITYTSHLLHYIAQNTDYFDPYPTAQRIKKQSNSFYKDNILNVESIFNNLKAQCTDKDTFLNLYLKEIELIPQYFYGTALKQFLREINF